MWYKNDYVLHIYVSHYVFDLHDATATTSQQNVDTKSNLEDDHNIFNYNSSKESDTASVDHLSEGEEEDTTPTPTDNATPSKNTTREGSVSVGVRTRGGSARGGSARGGSSRGGSARGSSARGGFARDGSSSSRTPTREGYAGFRTPRDGSTRVRTPTKVSQVGESVSGGFVFKTINGKTVRSEGGGDGSKYSAYSHRIRPIGFGVSWDPIDREPMLGPMPDIVQPEREQAEPEQAPPVIGRRESKRIKQIHFNKLPPPGPGLTLNDAMVLEMGTLSLVSEYLKDLEECMDDGDSRVAKEVKLFDAFEHKKYLKDLEECMDDGDSRVAKEVKLFDAFEHKSVVIEVDFVVLDYVNEEEPSILFRRDFLETTISQVDFELGEIRMNLTKLEHGIDVIDLLEEVGSSSEEVVKMGKENRNKGYNIKKLTSPSSLRLEEIPPISTTPPQLIYHPLTEKKKEKMKEVLDIKYKELEESKPILEVLENYVIYKKKLDEILLGYQAYMVGLLILDISVDPELPLLLGRPFLRTREAIIDIGIRTLCIDDGVIRHTYFPKPRSKSYVEAFKMEGEDDWLGSFEVGRDEDGNVKLESDDKQFGYKDYWTRVGKLTLINHKEMLVKEPLMWIVHKVIMGSLVHRVASRERCQKRDLWMMSALEESRYGFEDTLREMMKLEYIYEGDGDEKSFNVPSVANWRLFEGYGFEDTLREMMKLEYIYEGDGDVFVDYPVASRERCQKRDLWMMSALEESHGVNLAWSITDHLYKGSYGVGGDDYVTSAMPDFRGSSSRYADGGSSREAGFNDDDDMDE
nr:hypothetical protein [Tanacetum cinerariifolium]